MTRRDENISFAQAAYDAVGRGDIPWMQEHIHPDVVSQQGGRFPTAGTFHGRDAMLGHFMEFMAMTAPRAAVPYPLGGPGWVLM